MTAADQGDENLFDEAFVTDDNSRHLRAKLIETTTSAADALFDFLDGLHVCYSGILPNFALSLASCYRQCRQFLLTLGFSQRQKIIFDHLFEILRHTFRVELLFGLAAV